MTINIIHQGIDFTPALRSYVEEKMLSLKKYAKDIAHIDVEVGMPSHHHRKGNVFECKAVIQMVDSEEVYRIEKEAEDLYKAIDKVRDHFRAEFSDRKPRLSEKMRRRMSDM